MPAILSNHKLDDEAALGGIFLPYQLAWISDPARLCLAEKSVRIGWTFADAFKNVRQRLRHPRRDYLFTTKDEATALEYVRLCRQFCEWFGHADSVLEHGVERFKAPRANARHRWQTIEFKAGVIKFANGSRILAFSSNPNALRAFGGDVGMDEFAFHPDAETLWAAASGRVAWGFDLAVWPSHNGSQTLFHRFAQEAAAGQGGWSYYRVTMPDAIALGLLEKINRASGRRFTPESFLADCRQRARLPEIFAQEYFCDPAGAVAALVPWAALQRCQTDTRLERIHWEENEISALFGEFAPAHATARAASICACLRSAFAAVIAEPGDYALGFDVAASGSGDLAVLYLDRVAGPELHLAALLTCRTQDWHFLRVALEFFLQELPGVRGCGDETGLGRQICWETARRFPGRFTAINFAREKSSLGFLLMNELTTARKRFPRSEPDVAADFFALRKTHRSGHWTFTEGTNPLNAASHCDLAWAGALASRAASTPHLIQAVVL